MVNFADHMKIQFKLLRGVAYLFVICAVTSFISPANIPNPESGIREWVYDRIYFNSGRPRTMDEKELQDALLPRSLEILKDVVRFMEDYPKAGILIQAHTDDRGSKEYNRRLSERRVAAVKNHLLRQGIPADRLETQAFGETSPKFPNITDGRPNKNNRALNRRVEFKALGDWELNPLYGNDSL